MDGIAKVIIKMKNAIGVTVILLGVVTSILCFSAGVKLGDSGERLIHLRSRGGETMAEIYYQHFGVYGIAYSRLSYAFGTGSLLISFGLGSILILKESDI